MPHVGGRLSDRVLAVGLLAPAMVLMLAYVVYPLGDVVFSSVSEWKSLTDRGQFAGLQNFHELLNTGSRFLPSFGRSIYWTTGSVVVQTVLGLAIALLLNMRLPGRNVARAAVLLPFLVPGIVVSLLWRNLLDELTGVVSYLFMAAHIVDKPIPFLSSPAWTMNVIIVIASWKFTPFMIIFFLARLQSLPTEILEAARCDGARSFQLFRHIVMPWLLPVIVIAVMLRTIWTFNDFDIPFLLAQGGPVQSTLVLPILIRQLLLEQLNPGGAAAVSLVMVVLLAFVGLGYLTIYRRGETALRG